MIGEIKSLGRQDANIYLDAEVAQSGDSPAGFQPSLLATYIGTHLCESSFVHD